MSSDPAPVAPARVPLPTILAFGTIEMPVLAIGLIYGVYLPPNYAGLGLGLAAVAVAITTVRAVDVFIDPLLAMLMDRTKTPIGRYRPWLVLGAPIVMLGVWKVLMPSGPVTQLYLILWLLVSCAGPFHADAGVGRLVRRRGHDLQRPRPALRLDRADGHPRHRRRAAAAAASRTARSRRAWSPACRSWG